MRREPRKVDTQWFPKISWDVFSRGGSPVSYKCFWVLPLPHRRGVARKHSPPSTLYDRSRRSFYLSLSFDGLDPQSLFPSTIVRLDRDCRVVSARFRVVLPPLLRVSKSFQPSPPQALNANRCLVLQPAVRSHIICFHNHGRVTARYFSKVVYIFLHRGFRVRPEPFTAFSELLITSPSNTPIKPGQRYW